MSKHHSIPIELFDTLVYSSKHIPANIIQKWEKSGKTEEDQNIILSEYTEKGTVVASDFCGLTKLSSSGKNIVEIMKILSLPKEIIHTYATGIGGVPIGIWFADNSLVFYPDYIDRKFIISQMVAAQREILEAGFEVGMSMHYGDFIHIDGSIFGKDAQLVEETGENYTSGGEIIISENFLNGINLDNNLLTKRGDISINSRQSFYSIKYDNYIETKIKGSPLYPLPFDNDFFNQISNAEGDEYMDILKNREKTAFVLFVKIKHPYEFLILDELANYIFTDSKISEATKNDKTTKVKSNGIYAIFYGDKIEHILETIKSIINSLEEYYDFSIGVAYGSFLVFDLEDGQKEIAGNPVNISSKLAEDIGGENIIYFDESCGEISTEKYEFEISNIKLKGTFKGIEE